MAKLVGYCGDPQSTHVAAVWWQGHGGGSRVGTMWVQYKDEPQRTSRPKYVVYEYENITYGVYYYFTRYAKSLGRYTYYNFYRGDKDGGKVAEAPGDNPCGGSLGEDLYPGKRKSTVRNEQRKVRVR